MYARIKNKLENVISKVGLKIYQWRLRSRIRNKNFTILCSNCIGGIIYNRLGMRFLSPTINLWLTQRDFIKFAVNLKYYVSLDLEFVQTQEEYPVAKLDDILVYFNHSDSEEDARRDWNNRKERINYDNIYIIMYYREGYSLEEIRQIEKANCKNLIVLSSIEIDLEYAHYIQPTEGAPFADSFLDGDRIGIKTFEKNWDYVNWLNSEIS